MTDDTAERHLREELAKTRDELAKTKALVGTEVDFAEASFVRFMDRELDARALGQGNLAFAKPIESLAQSIIRLGKERDEAERRLKSFLTGLGADGADDETIARLHRLTEESKTNARDRKDMLDRIALLENQNGMLRFAAVALEDIRARLFSTAATKWSESEVADAIVDRVLCAEEVKDKANAAALAFSKKIDMRLSVEMETRNNAYAERNKVVVALAKLAIWLGWNAGVGYDEKADEGWRTVVFIDLPTGQVSWHFPDTEKPDLPVYKHALTESQWDGHTTAEKYERLARLGTK